MDLSQGAVAIIVAGATTIGSLVGVIVSETTRTILARRLKRDELGAQAADRALKAEDLAFTHMKLSLETVGRELAEERLLRTTTRDRLLFVERQVGRLTRALRRMKLVARHYRQKFANAEIARCDMQTALIRHNSECEREKSLLGDELRGARATIATLKLENQDLRRRRTGGMA